MRNTCKTIALLLLSILFCIGSCSCSSDNTAEDAPVTAESLPAADTSPSPFTDDLPQLDFEGNTVDICAWGYADAAGELYSEALDGEIVNDAVYNRNITVENRLNLGMNVVLVSDGGNQYTVSETVETAVAAGDDAYDIMAAPTYTCAYKCTGDIFVNLTDIEHLDLGKEYWAQGFNSSMSVGGKQYICTGTPAISLYRYMYVAVFNNSLVNDYNVTSPVGTVRSGNWTLEYLTSLTKSVYSDLNGNQKPDDADLYGFTSGARTSSDTWWINCGVDLFMKDENDYYLYQPESERLSDAVEAVLGLYGSAGSYVVPYDNDGVRENRIQTVFGEGRSMFAVSHLYGIEHNLRDMEDEYTIIPMPKLDEAQDDYYTAVQVELTGYAVTVTVPLDQLSLMGAFLECLASESYGTVYNAYYENALSYKYLQNTESVEMLDIIYKSVYIDPSVIYFNETGGMVISLRQMMRDRTDTVASSLASIESSVAENVAKMNELFRNLKH